MCVNPTILKRILFSLCGLVFAIVALRGVNAHLKLTVGAILASITAITLSDWSAIITIAWGLLQIGLLIPDYYRGFKKMMGKNDGVKS